MCLVHALGSVPVTAHAFDGGVAEAFKIQEQARQTAAKRLEAVTAKEQAAERTLKDAQVCGQVVSPRHGHWWLVCVMRSP